MSTTVGVSLDAPLGRRLLAWSRERWRPVQAAGVLLVYLTVLLFVQALAGGGELSISLGDLVPFVGLLAYSLLMRVLDEHKDWDHDVEHYPDRVLQTGRVELRHLKVVGAVAFAITLLVSLLEDGGIGPVTMSWAILMGWVYLMTKWFFVPGWMRPRRLAATVTSLQQIPLMILWVALMCTDGESLPAGLPWLMVVVALIGLAVDFGRRLEAPEDERPTLDSYTKTLGTKGAAFVLALLAMLSLPSAVVLLDAAGEGSVDRPRRARLGGGAAARGGVAVRGAAYAREGALGRAAGEVDGDLRAVRPGRRAARGPRGGLGVSAVVDVAAGGVLAAGDAVAAGEGRVGGKAIGLARLAGAGASVPWWVVLPVGAFERHLAQCRARRAGAR